jgi:hypothetical protein
MFELAIEPSSDRYDADDDRWRDQVVGLYGDLRRDAGGLRSEGAPGEGEKGGIATTIVELATSGALTAAVEALRTWLGRDRSRKVRLTWSAGGQRESLTVQGDCDEETFRAIAAAASSHFGAPGGASA